MVQGAGIAAVSTAHVGRPNLAAVTEESPQGAVLGILHDEKKWPWGQREAVLGKESGPASVTSRASEQAQIYSGSMDHEVVTHSWPTLTMGTLAPFKVQ